MKRSGADPTYSKGKQLTRVTAGPCTRIQHVDIGDLMQPDVIYAVSEHSVVRRQHDLVPEPDPLQPLKVCVPMTCNSDVARFTQTGSPFDVSDAAVQGRVGLSLPVISMTCSALDPNRPHWPPTWRENRALPRWKCCDGTICFRGRSYFHRLHICANPQPRYYPRRGNNRQSARGHQRHCAPAALASSNTHLVSPTSDPVQRFWGLAPEACTTALRERSWASPDRRRCHDLHGRLPWVAVEHIALVGHDVSLSFWPKRGRLRPSTTANDERPAESWSARRVYPGQTNTVRASMRRLSRWIQYNQSVKSRLVEAGPGIETRVHRWSRGLAQKLRFLA